MSEPTRLRPAVGLKHLYAALAGFAAYFVTAVVGMWIGMTGGLVLQELGLMYKWGAHMPLWKASLLFASGLVAAAVWLFVLWKMRRSLILAAKMCWYVPKAYLVWGAGECGVVSLAGMAILFVGCAICLGWVARLRSPFFLPVPLWLRAAMAGAGLAVTAVCVVAAVFATKVALRIAKVDDWPASVARSLGKIDMLAPPQVAPSAESDV